MQTYFTAILITFILVVTWVLIEKLGEAYSRRHPECPQRVSDCGSCADLGYCRAMNPKDSTPDQSS